MNKPKTLAEAMTSGIRAGMAEAMAEWRKAQIATFKALEPIIPLDCAHVWELPPGTASSEPQPGRMFICNKCGRTK